MPRKRQRSASRQAKKDENVRINSSTSDWSLELEGKKLHMNMIDKCSFEDLIKLRTDRESLDIMEKAATMFASNDVYVDDFRFYVHRLELSTVHSSLTSESEAEDTSDGKKRRVKFDDSISSCDAETKEFTDSDSTMAIDPVSDDSDDTTWSDGSEQDDLVVNESHTSMMKTFFLKVIGTTLERTCGLKIGITQGVQYVENGTSEFSSDNGGRCSFYVPGHECGGAEVFGTEDKRRGTSTTKKHRDKLQIQVAGAMLATVFHRNVLENCNPYREEILEACPNLQAWQTEPSRTVYYLVFTHLSLRIAKAVFDLKYLRQIQQGYLPEGLKADIMWSHRLRLNHEEDLREAARLVMCLMLNFRDEFLSGKH